MKNTRFSDVQGQGRLPSSGSSRLLILVSLPVLCAWVGPPVRAACEIPPGLAALRPGADGEPTRVTVEGVLVDLRGIDDSQQSFEADVVLFASWQDPRLVSESVPEPLVGCSLPLDQVWNPRLLLVNEREVRRLFDDRVTVRADGTVEYPQRLQGEFTTPLELRDFPFDRHELRLEIVAASFSSEEVILVPGQRSGRLEDLSITDWEISEGRVEVGERYVTATGKSMARITFLAPVRRRVGFYALKTFLPLTLIVCMSWAVFWIKPGLLPPQIGVSTSAVLTLIAFQFSLGFMLPRLSYLTRADRFLIGSTLLVFLAFGEAIWTSHLATHDREARAVAIDRRCRILFPLGFVVVLIVSFWV